MLPTLHLKKTVYLKSQSPPSKPGNGYDGEKYQQILSEYRFLTPRNRCTLNTNSTDPTMMSTSNMIQILRQTLTQSNTDILSNVALVGDKFENPQLFTSFCFESLRK